VERPSSYFFQSLAGEKVTNQLVFERNLAGENVKRVTRISDTIADIYNIVGRDGQYKMRVRT